MGWRRDDCISLDVGAGSLEERELPMSGATGIGKREGSDGSDVETEALLAVALQLDRRAAPAALLQSALPEWLLRQNALGCLLLGRALVRDGKLHEAEKLLLQALSLSNMLGAAHRELGILMRAEGRSADAASAFESALAMRRRIAFDGNADSTNPVLVAQPHDAVDVVYYARHFYVVPKHTGLVGARAIAGELFAVRSNFSFRIARQIAHAPFVRGFLSLRSLRVRNQEDTSSKIKLPRFVRRSARAITNALRQAIRQVALLLFAERIEQRTGSLMDAIDLADQHLSRVRRPSNQT